MGEMLTMLESCFDRLQNLNIQPTLGNMEKLVSTLYDLREIYGRIKESEVVKDGKDSGADTGAADPENGPAADPEGRDDH